MALLRTTIAALLLLTPAAFAQSNVPTAPTGEAAPAAPTSGASTLTKDGKPRMKIVRAECRDQAKSRNLTGDARKQAVADCIVKQRPDMEARVKCQMDPSLKGMSKDDRRSAMKACVAKAKA